MDMANKQKIKTLNQLILFITKPAKNLPIAIEKANIPETWILMDEANCSCLLLNVGNQHIMLCSIRVYKKTLETNKIIKGTRTNFIIAANSSFIKGFLPFFAWI